MCFKWNICSLGRLLFYCIRKSNTNKRCYDFKKHFIVLKFSVERISTKKQYRLKLVAVWICNCPKKYSISFPLVFMILAGLNSSCDNLDLKWACSHYRTALYCLTGLRTVYRNIFPYRFITIYHHLLSFGNFKFEADVNFLLWEVQKLLKT